MSGTDVLSATWWLATLGTGGVFLVLFVETGLLVGFFLPGDSLLFTAGLLTATGAGSLHLSLPWVLVAAVAGAVLGAQTGFVVGRRAGPPLLERSRSRRLRAGAERAGEYLERYGHRKAIVLARFVPIVRTVLNPLAGAVGVPARVFLVWQTLGGAVWAIGLTLAGHVLGTYVPGVDQYLLPVVAVVVVVSLLPFAIELIRERRRQRAGQSAQCEEPETGESGDDAVDTEGA